MRKGPIYITGASTGIGAALSRALAAEGVVLCLLANSDGESFEQVIKACRERGAEAHAFFADVANREDMQAIAHKILQDIGVPTLVIANAGIGPADPEDYFASDIAEKVMAVNFFGTINTVVPFIDPMKQSGGGHFVIVSSVSALRSTPNSGLYSASKAAVSRWAEGIRFRLKPFGINTTTICPGFVDTSMTQGNRFVMPGIISPDKAASLIIRAIARKRATYYMPLVARLIWRTFYFIPDGIYNSVIMIAYRHWPSRN